MYIADQGNSRVREVDVTTGLITTITGASQSRGDSGPPALATFNNPRGVAVGLDGSVFISDTNNNKVRKITGGTSPVINTYVGTGAAGNGVGAGTSTPLNLPGCVAVDQTGTLYIADRVSSKIKRVDVYGNVTNAVSSNTASVNKTGVVSVGGLATGYNGDGGPAVADKVGIATSGGGFMSSGSSSNTNGPNCVTVDNNGELFIADTGNNVIRKVDASGILTTVAGYATVTVGNNGVPSNSGVSGSEGDGGLATNAQFNSPRGVGVDPGGNFLCIADTSNNAVRQVNLKTGIVLQTGGIGVDGGSDTLPANGWQSRVSGPEGCAMDAALNTYVADTGNNRILLITPAGQMSLIAGGGSTFGGDGKAATAAQVNAPVGIAVDTATPANVYFTDRYGLIRKLTPNPPASK
jgi:hypothetical protein